MNILKVSLNFTSLTALMVGTLLATASPTPAWGQDSRLPAQPVPVTRQVGKVSTPPASGGNLAGPSEAVTSTGALGRALPEPAADPNPALERTPRARRNPPAVRPGRSYDPVPTLIIHGF